jgi:hypothetical protein
MDATTDTSAPIAQPTATDTLRASRPEPACCGGPAPEPASACCARDAEAKSAGAPGCGCAPEPAAARKSCC